MTAIRAHLYHDGREVEVDRADLRWATVSFADQSVFPAECVRDHFRPGWGWVPCRPLAGIQGAKFYERLRAPDHGDLAASNLLDQALPRTRTLRPATRRELADFWNLGALFRRALRRLRGAA